MQQAFDFLNKHVKFFELGKTLITNSGIEFKWEDETIIKEIDGIKYTLGVDKEKDYEDGDYIGTTTTHRLEIETGSDETYEEFWHCSSYIRYIRGKFYKYVELSNDTGVSVEKWPLPHNERTGDMCEMEWQSSIYISGTKKGEYDLKNILEEFHKWSLITIKSYHL